ncbi:unnamed protein product [Didymodactylos carnosus]|uniref:long-chain-fatty-acid--CoA ligase n=1 Tax=Didymodactylos carnosus TaxID=1234261 RepID=A0A814CMY9_9BILA|nr:unnamed protein product [Didymodactylos carnosus]CAF3720814.1 unnamed protein product [Didymodactylos carnosus]
MPDLSRIFESALNTAFKRFLVTILKTTLVCLIAFFFVQIPTIGRFLMTIGKDDDRSKKQKRLRAKIVDKNDPSSPYRAVEVVDELKYIPEDGIHTLADIPDLTIKRFADRETLGVREILNVEDETQPNGKVFKKFILGEYKFTTYKEAHEHILAIGKGLLSLGLKQGDRILLFAETRPEWLLTAFAAFRHGITVVTLYSTLGDEAVRHGITESEVEVIVTSTELVPKLEKILEKTKKVHHVIYFPGFKQIHPTDKNDIEFHSLQQLEEKGKQANIDGFILNKRPKPQDIAVIMYTSGSTGAPKGVLITHENIIAAMTGQKERVFPMVDLETHVYIAYLPLAHILELCCELLVYYSGVKCGYSSPQTLTDQSTAIKRGQKGDLQVLRPHLMSCVPTILDRIHKTVNEKINQANFFQRHLFYLCYKIKVKRLEEGLDSPHLDNLIFKKFNQLVLGGRVRTMLCGGAVLSEDTQRFVQAALCITLFQGYGLTETCAGGSIADQHDISVGRAGYPLVCCEMRLENWDEDKPNPRGEILIGGKMVAVGYFAEAAKENVNFKEINGTRYFSTGDIGEIFPDGTIKIVDRKKDLIKLRGGEYVSLTKVEMAIGKVPIVENCCLCASSSAEYTVLLVSPNQKNMTSYTEKHFDTKEWQKLIDDEEFVGQVLKDVQEACRKGGIERFETPQRVRIVPDAWTPETGLVTDALKLKRKAIELKYQDDIDTLYKDEPKQKQNKKGGSSRTKSSNSNETNDNDKKQKSSKEENKENNNQKKDSSKEDNEKNEQQAKEPTDVAQDVIADK